MTNLLISLTFYGTSIFLFWIITYPITKKFLNANWHYIVLKLSLLLYIIPIVKILNKIFNFLEIHDTFTAIKHYNPTNVFFNKSVSLTQIDIYNTIQNHTNSFNIKNAIIYIWIFGAILIFFNKIRIYIKLKTTIYKNSSIINNKKTLLILEQCKHNIGYKGIISLRKSDTVETPIVIGLFKPTIILPTSKILKEDLHYIFLHEIAHIKNKDLHFRLLNSFVNIIHWFNPFTYILSKKIIYLSESYCDETVVYNMDKLERKKYGIVLLKVASNTINGIDFCAGLSCKNRLKRRLSFMYNFNKMGKIKIIIGNLFLSLMIVLTLSLSFEFTSNKFTSYAESSTSKEAAVHCKDLLDKNNYISKAFSFDDLIKIYAFNNKIDEKEAYINMLQFLNYPLEDERKNKTYRIIVSTINVSDYYKPHMYIYCKTLEEKNDEYDYSIEKIVHAEINGKYNDIKKKFAGSIYTNLESPNRIFWNINGDFFDSGVTKTTLSQHDKTAYLVSYDISDLGLHYKYYYEENRLHVDK